jgi:HAD superfamily hydrolase (TIGR01549 family)
MVELAFPEHSPEQIEPLKQRFLEIYFDNIAHHAQLFPGLDVTMEYLAKYNIPWGIVTNKPQKLTQQLLTHFDFPSPPKTVISGDTFDVRKPHPKPLLMAAKDCHIAPNECLYLGDHPRDIEAGKNAKMITGAALYGYIPPSENSEQWSADHYFATPHDINLFIQNQLKSE